MDSQNPIGIMNLDHFEFTSDAKTTPTAKLFSTLGFQKTHENDTSALYQQGQIRFMIHADPNQESHSRQYFNKHGEGVSKISFQVQNAQQALETAVKRGAVEVQNIHTQETEQGIIKTAQIKGFGDVLNEFIEKPNATFKKDLQEVTDHSFNPLKTRVSRVDHFTNNVPFGEMEHWVNFYKTVYGFKETRYFDIKGLKTGLQSKVVQLANNQVIIPINEPEVPNGKSQIQEFLDTHKGAGVQHIALMTPDIISTVTELRERNMKFLNVPNTYYQDISKRPFKVEEAIEDLQKINLLADGDETGYLLQIFSETYVGPLFFEYIQRKNHWGFGEGNFQALFDSIERDQMERGYL